MPIIDETCKHCGDPLRFGARADMRYCSSRCRVYATRERKRTLIANLERFGMDPIDLELRRRQSALITPATHRRPDRKDGLPNRRDPPVPIGQIEPTTPLDDIDLWFLTPIVLADNP